MVVVQHVHLYGLLCVLHSYGLLCVLHSYDLTLVVQHVRLYGLLCVLHSYDLLCVLHSYDLTVVMCSDYLVRCLTWCSVCLVRHRLCRPSHASYLEEWQ